jgi:hypothetical protein
MPGIKVREVGKGLIDRERRRSGSVVVGEGAPAVLGVGLRALEHHRAMRKVVVRSG